MQDDFDLTEAISEVNVSMENIRERADKFKNDVRNSNLRTADKSKDLLEEAILLLSETGVTIFDMRYVSWRIERYLHVLGYNSPLKPTALKATEGIRYNIFAMTELNKSLHEITRSIRSFLAY